MRSTTARITVASYLGPNAQTLFPPFQKYITRGYVSEEEAGNRLAQARLSANLHSSVSLVCCPRCCQCSLHAAATHRHRPCTWSVHLQLASPSAVAEGGSYISAANRDSAHNSHKLTRDTSIVWSRDTSTVCSRTASIQAVADMHLLLDAGNTQFVESAVAWLRWS
jgi:hypothetical protein